MEESQTPILKIDQKLDILYDLLVSNYGDLTRDLSYLIANPQEIANTNFFASLLTKLNDMDFINLLLIQINNSQKGDPWLSDFLYSVNNLLAEASSEEDFDIPDGLIDKLEVWILNYDGQLPWYAATLLKFYDSEKADNIRLQKLNQEDFFLTHVECIIGLLRHDKEKYIDLVRSIAIDEGRDIDLREFCSELLEEK
jgi:hypothetical protein